MARRYSSSESAVRGRIQERSKKGRPEDWSSAPRFWSETGEIYLCQSCTVSLLLELGVSLEKIAQCKRFDWRKSSVETIAAFEGMGGWLGDVLPKPEPAAKTAVEPASDSDTKQLLKAIAGMSQQMQANQAAISQLFKMITE